MLQIILGGVNSGTTTPSTPDSGNSGTTTPDTGNAGNSGSSGSSSSGTSGGSSGDSGTTAPDTGNTGDSGNSGGSSGGTSGGDSGTKPTTPDTGNTSDSGNSSTIIDTSGYKPGDVIYSFEPPVSLERDGRNWIIPYPFVGDNDRPYGGYEHRFTSEFIEDIQYMLKNEVWEVFPNSFFCLSHAGGQFATGTAVAVWNAEAGLFYCFLLSSTYTNDVDEAKSMIVTDWEHGGEFISSLSHTPGDVGFVMKIQ